MSSPKLIWLLAIHRHGDRAPLNMAPRDKYNHIKYWPEGFGNLNNAGRARMYNLGKFIRKRYSNFLTDNIREVYSRSSDVDRCIESAHAVMAGMYPPGSRYEWNPELAWVPAPVHTVPASEDYLLNDSGRKYFHDLITEMAKIQESEAVKKLYEDSKEDRVILEKEMGYEYDMFFKFKCTYSTLDIEQRAGYEIPAWITPELKQRLYHYAGIAFALAGGGTERLRQIRCGHLLEDIVTRMEIAPIDRSAESEQKSDFRQPTNLPNETSEKRITHYSTHDSIIAALLEALNLTDPVPVPPGFGATFFIELYVDVDEKGNALGDKYVKLYYLDDTESENPIEKLLPNCKQTKDGKVTLQEFKNYVKHLFPNDPL